MSALLVNLSVLLARPTGISVYARNLLPALKALDPVLLASRAISEFECQTIPYGISPGFGNWGHLKRLFWLQKDIPPYARELGAQQGGSLLWSPSPEAPLYTDCRFVVTAHDTIPLRFSKDFSAPLVGYFRHYVRRVLAQAEHVFCNSVSTARDVAEFYGVPERKLTSIPLAYDKKRFRPYQAAARMPASHYFIYVGRQNTYKNLARLISAFHRVHQVHPDLELWLVGPKDRRYTPALVAQTQFLAIAHQVHFLDYVADDQLPKLLSEAIALTFPSLWEGFGLPVLEAMACGTPVITSNLSSLPEVVGDAALLIDPYNVDELADAMKIVATDTQLRQKLSQAGLDRAKHFSWEATGQQTVEVLQQFL